MTEYKHYADQDNRHLDQYDWWTWLGKIGMTDNDLRIREIMDSAPTFGESMRDSRPSVDAGAYVDVDYIDPQTYG